jgi:hypothetical protein
MQSHGDDHLSGPLIGFRPLKQKTHSGCEWVETFFLLNPLTETPPATWLCAK